MRSVDVLLYIYWLLVSTQNAVRSPMQIVETNMHTLQLFTLYLNFYRKEDKVKAKRKYWVRPIFHSEKRFSQGASNNLVREMASTDSEKYLQYLRMSKADFEKLLKKVEPYIEKQHAIREPIPAYTRLQICLRYLASGESMTSISFAFRVSSNTVSKIIHETCFAIWIALKESVFPKPSTEMWYNQSRQFEDKWNFCHCIGAVDGKIVAMQAPPNSGCSYYTYKSHFGLNLMAVADANYRFIYVDIGAPGRRSDGGIFKESKIGRKLESDNLHVPPADPLEENGEKMPYVLVGDEAFALSTYMMRPYPRASELNFRKKIFNYRLSRARRVVENAFGILGARFRIYRTSINGSVKLVRKVVQATTCLHNWLLTRDLEDGISEDCRSYGHLTPTERALRANALQDLLPLEERNDMQVEDEILSAIRVREEFARYYEGAGALPWQWEKVLRNQF